jgi:hypothetical protein
MCSKLEKLKSEGDPGPLNAALGVSACIQNLRSYLTSKMAFLTSWKFETELSFQSLILEDF